MARSGKSRRSGWLLFLLLIVGVFLGGYLVPLVVLTCLFSLGRVRPMVLCHLLL